MAKYAELYFAEQEENIPINKYLMKLPQNIRNKVLKWKLALKYEEKTMWEIKGENIQMPMTYRMYKQMPLTLRNELFEKIEKKLEQRGITHVVLPGFINTSPFKVIQECTGHYIKPFFIMDAICFIAKEKIIDKELQHLEIVILDGNSQEVDIIIDFIYPYINHLTVISNAPERFEQKAEAIFNDVGLNMQILSYTKGALSQADIIIDTHYDDPSVIHMCKAKTVYLDIGNHAEKTIMLLERQNGVLVIDKFLLVKNGEVVNITKAELLLTINQTLTRNYKETMKRLKKQNIKIYRLRE
ncbi:MAG TPA: hypothetical protein GX707_20525 [Epulopiscium sp.]|nr:hypothetical protein [Candidatus Epulonipiscium sp.]